MKYFTNLFNSKNSWWRYLLVIFISFIIGAQFIGSIPFSIVAIAKCYKLGLEMTPENLMNLHLLEIDLNLGLFLLMLPFVIGLFLLLILYKPFHKRSVGLLFSGEKKIRWNRFFSSAGVWILLMAIYLIIDISISGDDYQFNFNLKSFLLLMLVSIVMIPIQSSYEEVLFRGYLAQGIAVWTKNKILVIIIPSLLFGLMHIINPEVAEYGFWLTMPQYILFGLVFGLISVLDDGIELAMGAHSANNLFLSLFVTSKASALQTPAVFINENVDPAKDLVIMIVVGIVFVYTIGKLYKFNYSSLFLKIEAPKE